MGHRVRKIAALFAAGGIVAAGLVAAPTSATGTPTGDVARYILPPGNYGGLPTTDNSTDQLPLYDALTPLRGNVTDTDIQNLFLPEDFQPIGATHEEVTGRPGVQILYDSYGVAHVTGETRADVAFGAGWVTARDRGLLLQLGRGPARVAVADVPGIDAFSLVTSGQSFVPSAATEALVTAQQDLLVQTYGDKGREIIADAQAEADGANAYWAATGGDVPPVTVNDVIATTAFIGSIFGAGGGGEASNSNLLAVLQDQLGPVQGHKAWDDAMLSEDPEAPTTTRRKYDYGALTGGDVTGSITIDAGSIVALDPRGAAAPPTQLAPAPTTEASPVSRSGPTSGSGSNATAAATSTSISGTSSDPVFVDASAAPPGRQASNFLVVAPRRSANRNPLAVMGPQLGYYYPEIVQQIHLSGPGIEAQGAAVPGIAMYILIGRTPDYAWSLTSANHDVRDVFAEQLCEPDGSTPTRASTHYVFEGQCRPFEQFDAGTLNGVPIRYPRSVHGSMIGTATVGGQPYALTRQRSTFGRDGLNLAALHDMTGGAASNVNAFYDTANEFGFTFNWAYVNRRETGYFSSGYLPVRHSGLDRRLPTLGTGDYEWQGYLSRDQHPHDSGGPGGLLLNWNNKSAPGFMHGDDEAYGSVHRVELFDKFPAGVTLADDVSIMNRAATEDVRSPVWPTVRAVLATGPAPNALDQQVVSILDDWVADDAPRLDADNSGTYDSPGPTIMDAVWRPIAEAVMAPVYGPSLSTLNQVRNLGGLAGESYVDKDLRTLLKQPVKGRFALKYCGNGSLDACRASLWTAIDQAVAGLAAAQGANPAAWRSTASTTTFVPGLIPNRMRTTNRPTFQQVLELVRQR
jgi:acyl-homoserine lactone acylase PvdQ